MTLSTSEPAPPAPAGDRLGALRRHGWWLTLAVAVVLHLPGFVVRLVNSDEASLATMAVVLRRGGRLYHQTADRKPPIVPYLYSLVFRVTGSTDLRPVRVVGVAVVFATAVLLASEARRRYGSDRVATVCGLLFLLAFAAFFPDDSQAATFELFMLLPMTAAMIAAGRDRAFAAGLLLALACLCKQTAITTALPIAYLLYQRRGTSGLARAALGFTLPIGFAALLFEPRPFFLWTVTGNGGYLSGQGSVVQTLVRALGMTGALAGLEIGLLALCAVSLRHRAASIDLWLWLLSAMVAVTAGFRFFGHYYLQLLPAAALIAAAALEKLTANAGRLALGSLALPAVVCTTVGFFPTGDNATVPYIEIATRVRALTDADDTVFVWGDLPELYWASGRRPGSRFIHTGFLTGNSGGRGDGVGDSANALPGSWGMLTDDLARRVPDLIVDTSNGSIRQQQFYPLSSTPLWPLVTSRYRLVGTVEGVLLYALDGQR